MSDTEQQQAKKAFLRRHPNLTKLVNRLLQSEDADELLKRLETIEKSRNRTDN